MKIFRIFLIFTFLFFLYGCPSSGSSGNESSPKTIELPSSNPDEPSDDSDSGQPSDDSDSGQPSDDSDSGQPSDDSDSGQPSDDSDSGQPSDDSDTSATFVPTGPSHTVGLVNLGNTCYMDSTLQALMHTKGLFDFYSQETLPIVTDAENGGKLSKAYQHFVKKYSKKSHESSFAPRKLKHALQNHSIFKGKPEWKMVDGTYQEVIERFEICEQQDAYEFISKIFDSLGDEVGQKKLTKEELPSSYSEDFSKALLKRFNSFLYNYSIFNKLFSFGVKSKLRCYNDEEVVYDSEEDGIHISVQGALTLGFSDDHSQKFTLESMLEEYFKEEASEGLRNYNCGGKRDITNKITKQLSLQSAPGLGGKEGYLILHLSRFEQIPGTENSKKIKNPVTYPEILSLKPSEQKGETVKFRLYSIVNHFGDVGGGHYKAVIRDRNSGKWFEANDDRIKPLSIEQVLTNYKDSSYIFFYEKI